MTREEEIKSVIDTIFGEKGRTSEQVAVAKGFETGVRWADEHPKQTWISVNDDLPCNHKDFVFGTPFGTVTKEVLVLTARGYYIAYMHFNKEWSWSTDRKVSHWMQIPNLD